MTRQWFEETEQYTIDDALGERAWPQTLSLIRIDEEGKTSSGWSRERFMTNYSRGFFKPAKILEEFTTGGYPFAFLMRSIPVLTADIDGKNGGIQASSILRLPRTLAETSKGGNGFHLFYRVPEAVWHPEFGYDEFPDANSIVPGVDIRYSGIIYHYPNQRWNAEELAPLPSSLRKLMEQKKKELEFKREAREVPLTGGDLAIAQEQALSSLARQIPKGKRNTTLFAVGCALQLYQVANWEDLLLARGDQLGMDAKELSIIIRHVKQYA